MVRLLQLLAAVAAVGAEPVKEQVAFQQPFGSPPIRTLSLSADGRTLAAAFDGRLVRVWDVPAGKESRTISPSGGPSQGRSAYAALTPDGKTLALAGIDLGVSLWDVGSGKARPALRPNLMSTGSVAISADGKLVAGGGVGEIRVWEVATGRSRPPVRFTAAPRRGADPFTSKEVLCLAFAPGGKTVAAGCRDQTVKLFDTATGRAAGVLGGHFGYLKAVAISPDGKVLASASIGELDSKQGDLVLWDAASRKQLTRMKLDESSLVGGMAFTPDGKSLLLAGNITNPGLRVLDVASRKVEDSPSPVQCFSWGLIAVSANGKVVAMGDQACHVKVWDLAEVLKRKEP